MESRRTVENKANFSSDEVSSKFAEQHLPPFEDEQRRNEFVSSFQSRCENILRQVRLFKGTSDVTAVSKDSADSSESNLTSEISSGFKSKEQLSLELTSEQLSQSIEQRFERITELLRSHNIPIASMQKIMREDSTRSDGAQKLLEHNGYQNINTKSITEHQDQERWKVVGRTSDDKHVTLGSGENADEKTKGATSNYSTEEQAAKGQTNRELLATTEECCDGMKNAPDPESRDKETEGGSKKLLECEKNSGGEAENEFGDLISTSCVEDKCAFPNDNCPDCKFMIYWRLKTIEENKARSEACSDQTEIKTAKDASSTIDSLKRKHCPTAMQTTSDEKQFKQMACEIRAKQLVQEVFNSIGCYESFVGRADWADEPCSPPGDLVTIPVAYSFANPCKKVYSTSLEGKASEKDERQPSISEDTSNQRRQDDKHPPKSEVTCYETKQDRHMPTLEVTSGNAKKDDGHLPISELTYNDAKQEDGQMSTSEVTCSGNSDDAAFAIPTAEGLITANIEEPITANIKGPITANIEEPITANIEGPITANIEEPSAIVTSCNVRNRSQKRLSFKHGRKRWAELNKRQRSFVIGKKGNTRTGDRNDRLTTKEPATEATTSSEEETYKLTLDEEKLTALKEFIALGGTRTEDGDDVVILNPSKIPSKREFTGRKEYNEVMDFLLLHAQKFTEEKVETDNFVLTVHAANRKRSRLRSRKWAMEFYKEFLRQRYQDRLTRCVLYKPSLKLRTLVALSRPFISNCMKDKIYIVKSRRDFARAQGLPESFHCV